MGQAALGTYFFLDNHPVPISQGEGGAFVPPETQKPSKVDGVFAELLKMGQVPPDVVIPYLLGVQQHCLVLSEPCVYYLNLGNNPLRRGLLLSSLLYR